MLSSCCAVQRQVSVPLTWSSRPRGEPFGWVAKYPVSPHPCAASSHAGSGWLRVKNQPQCSPELGNEATVRLVAFHRVPLASSMYLSLSYALRAGTGTRAATLGHLPLSSSTLSTTHSSGRVRTHGPLSTLNLSYHGVIGLYHDALEVSTPRAWPPRRFHVSGMPGTVGGVQCLIALYMEIFARSTLR